MCPYNHGSFKNRECHYKEIDSDIIHYECLNRGDVSPFEIFQKPINAKKARFPLLNNALEFNKTGFWCDHEKDIFIMWTMEDMHQLMYSLTPFCTLKDYGIIDGLGSGYNF